MTAPLFVFVHGWGFGPGLWDGVRAHLRGGDSVTVDLGYFGPPVVPALPVGRPVVAVGHSFGVLWLLHEAPFAWDGLVAVNGFPRFTEAPGYAPATPRRVLDRMIARFGAAPVAVLNEFRRRCGCLDPAPACDAERLGSGLRALRDWDARPALRAPLRALAGRGDPIVPPAMTTQAFAEFPVDWHPEAGHLLPQTAPEWCAARIATWAADWETTR